MSLLSLKTPRLLWVALKPTPLFLMQIQRGKNGDPMLVKIHIKEAQGCAEWHDIKIKNKKWNDK